MKARTIALPLALLCAAIVMTSAMAETSTGRTIKLDSPDPAANDPFGNVLIKQNALGVELFFNVHGVGVHSADGRQALALYVWTPTLGRLRLETFTTSPQGLDYSGAPVNVDHPEFVTEPICLEVWADSDDGIDAPDQPGAAGFLVLRGEDGVGAPCTDLKLP